MYDLAIIGGGPAGLTAALYALRAGKKVVLFEGNNLGGTLNDIERIENYPGFSSISGKDLAKNMVEQILPFNPTIIKNFALNILRDEDEGHFNILTSTEQIEAKNVILCLGSKRNTLPAVDKFEGGGVSYCAVCDGFFYKGKSVVVIGNGYNAKEDIEYLLPLCKKVYLIGKVDFNIKADNFEYLKSESLIKVLGNEKVEGVILKSGREVQLDGIFIALGTKKSALLDGLNVKEGQEDLKLNDGLYQAGDMCSKFKQVVFAAAQAAKAVDEIFK